MKFNKRIGFISILILMLLSNLSCTPTEDDRIVYYVINPKKEKIQFFWTDQDGVPYRSIQNLKEYAEKQGKGLKFAMNGGIYLPGGDNVPEGLFIENAITQTAINLKDGTGNFYMKPNGVFYLSKNGVAEICKSEDFVMSQNIEYATQSGPLLLHNGQMHKDFKEGSSNLHVRNGVGIMPDGSVLFAISNVEINLYDFAMFFKNKGCMNALYLDGVVSRMYLPEKKWEQLDGDFGVIIGVLN